MTTDPVTLDALELAADALESALAVLDVAARREAKAFGDPDGDSPSGVPAYDAILAAALDATGLAEGFAAGTLDGRQHLDVLRGVVVEAERMFRGWAEELLAEIAPDSTKALMGGVRAAVGRFVDRLGKGIREVIAAGVLALAGPDPAVLKDPVVQEAMEAEIDRQRGYLDAFHERILTERKPLDRRIVSNAEQFGSSTWGTAQEVERRRMIATGRREARRRLGPVEHCADCPPLADLGWQPIELVPRIGFKDLDGNPTECMMQCECWLEFR